jgi:hypothetical protein
MLLSMEAQTISTWCYKTDHTYQIQPETTKEVLRNLHKQQTKERTVVLRIPKCISSHNYRNVPPFLGKLSELCTTR